jgi:hypothetical protein
LPGVAPNGTGTTICVLLQLLGVPASPLNVTVLLPWLAPKFPPVMVMGVPTAAVVNDNVLMNGPGAKLTPLLAIPLAVTTTFPGVAPIGTGTTMLVLLQLVGCPGVPLKVTVPVPWLEPKFNPVIVSGPPSANVLADKEVITGAAVNNTPLLATPPTVTTTLPVVTPLGTNTLMLLFVQFAGVTVVPLNVTVLLPWLPPKPDPVTLTSVPTGPEAGVTPAMNVPTP